jgi:uridine phosphorylase
MQTTQAIGDPIDTNFPKDAEGRPYHVGCKSGEIANRVLLVGDPDRAKLLRSLLDISEPCFERISNRGFTTYTGKMNGKAVTIMSIGMGMPMKDFAVREIRAVTKGDLAIIRLGSCGTPRADIRASTVVAAKSSFSITTDTDAVLDDNPTRACYRFSKPISPDPRLHDLMVKALQNNAKDQFPVVEGQDATADSFYSSQGRIDPEFDDRNEDLVKQMPEASSLQMETYHMFYLAALSNRANKLKQNPQMIRTAACAIVLANRITNDFLPNDAKHKIELLAGKACLEALTSAL